VERRQELIQLLTTLKTAIESAKVVVDQLPFFARSFAVQDFTSSTGMSFDEWLRTIGDLLSALQAGGPLSEQALQGARKLVLHLDRYADYALSIPDKVRMASQFISIEKELIELAEQAPKLAELAKALKQSLEALLKESK